MSTGLQRSSKPLCYHVEIPVIQSASIFTHSTFSPDELNLAMSIFFFVQELNFRLLDLTHINYNLARVLMFSIGPLYRCSTIALSIACNDEGLLDLVFLTKIFEI